MALYNGNNAYLSIGGYVVGAAAGADSNLFINMELSFSTGDENMDAGSGIEWERHAPKLNVANGTIQIAYDTDSVVADLQGVLDSGQGSVEPVVYGPEGNTAGKLKHDQDFLITQVSGPTVNVQKSRVLFEITIVSDGPPRSNMYAGDTF